MPAQPWWIITKSKLVQFYCFCSIYIYLLVQGSSHPHSLTPPPDGEPALPNRDRSRSRPGRLLETSFRQREQGLIWAHHPWAFMHDCLGLCPASVWSVDSLCCFLQEEDRAPITYSEQQYGSVAPGTDLRKRKRVFTQPWLLSHSLGTHQLKAITPSIFLTLGKGIVQHANT